MSHHETVTIEVDPKALANAEKIWCNFTKVSKYGVLTIIAILVGLALAFVKFF